LCSHTLKGVGVAENWRRYYLKNRVSCSLFNKIAPRLEGCRAKGLLNATY
jgi:hypothetical protein